MKLHVTYLERRANGGVKRRRIELDAPQIRFGRGAHNEVYLPDHRVGLDHAELGLSGGNVMLSATGDHDVKDGTSSLRQIELKVGQSAQLGPYKIEVETPPDGFQAAITVELVEPEDRALEVDLQAQRMALHQAMPGKRTLSWLTAIVILALFLVIPYLGAFYSSNAIKPVDGNGNFRAAVRNIVSDNAWISGPLSDPHTMLQGQCGACHEKPFVMVKDESCAACHSEIRHHADLKMLGDALTARSEVRKIMNMPWEVISGNPARCGSCHREHNGKDGLIPKSDALCTDCHAKITKTTKTALLDVTDFGVDHPEFRVRVFQDHSKGWDGQPRISLDANPRPVEVSGLKFPHDKHLARIDAKTNQPTLVVKQNDGKPLVCANCHVPEPGGEGFEPIRMEKYCGASCHALTFDEKSPERRLPHGQPREVAEIIRDHYSRIALSGKAEDAGGQPIIRRIPGSQVSQADLRKAEEWAQENSTSALRNLFTKSHCGQCHKVEEDNTDPAGWKVTPARVASNWIPKGRFDHSRHETMQCTDCHKAPASKVSSDIMIPGIQTCRNCHGGEDSFAMVPSPCLSCHQYHQDTDKKGSMPMVEQSALTSARNGIEEVRLEYNAN